MPAKTTPPIATVAMPAEMKRLHELCDQYAASSKDMTLLHARLDREFHKLLAGHKDDLVALEQLQKFALASIEDLARQHPEWFGDKSSLHTPVGVIKLTPTRSLSIANEEKTLNALFLRADRVAGFDATRLRPVSEQTRIVQKDWETSRRKKASSVTVEADETPEVENSRALANRVASAIVQEYTIAPGKGDDDARSALSLIIGAQLLESPMDKDPKAALSEALTLANDLLVEARSLLSRVQRNSKFEELITHALNPIGQLRFALRSGGLTR